MLDFLRKSASTWVAKILFGLLILSFGVWGIGDVVRGGADQVAAIRVGDIEVSPQYVRQQFDRQVERLRQALGQDFSSEQARQMGFLDATVREVVTSTTLDMAAQDMGISVSEEALRTSLRSTPAFQTEDGQFSPDRFRRVLAANNLTEERYLAILRGDIARQRLGAPLATGAAPEALVDRLFAYRQEARSVDVLRIDAAKLVVTEEPEETALRDIYDAQLTRFTAPEYRGGKAILLRQDELVNRVEVSDAAIEDFYHANIDRFTTPAKREVVQVIVDTEATAAKVSQLAQAGTSLADAATQAGATAPIEMGAVARDALPPSAADAVFAIAPGGVTAPVESPLGWHVFGVKAVTDGTTQPLDEVREDIRQEIAHERAVDVLYEESANLDDALGGGATLEEAAQQLNLPLITIAAVDIDGKTPEGQAADLPEDGVGATIVQTLFDLEEGLDSRLRDIPGGYVVVRVDQVTPPQPRPFDSVQDTVRDVWLSQKRQEQATALAQELNDAAAGPRTMEGLTEGRNAVTYDRIDDVTRAAASQGRVALPGALVSQVFDLQPGQTAWADTRNGAVVVRVADIAAADPASQQEARAALTDSLRAQIGQDLLGQAINAYGSRYGVEINNAAIQQAF